MADLDEKGLENLEFVFDIDCSSDAKGARLQARCDTTITGLRWTLTGDLAKCIAIRAYEAAKGVGEPVAWAMPSALEKVARFWLHNVQLASCETDLCTIPLYAAPQPSHSRDDLSSLLGVIADIREKTGVGAKPMLFELADAVAALSASLQREGWRDIGTAPKDGTMILLFNEAHGEQAVMGWTEDSSWTDGFTLRSQHIEGCWTNVGAKNAGISMVANDGYFQAWQPLPSPPKKGGLHEQRG